MGKKRHSSSDSSDDINRQIQAKEQQLKATLQQVKAANQQLQASEQQLRAANQQLKADEEELRRLNHDLGERVKELNCLYGLSRLVEQPNITLEQVFQGLAELIPLAWEYPEITCAQVVFGGRRFKTSNFRKTRWIQSADIEVFGKKAGAIEVCYLKKMPELDEGPFLMAERDLLNDLAERLSEIIELRLEEQQLRALNEQLSVSEQRLKASNQQLKAGEQQLKAANQQLQASEQQLRAANQQLQAEVAERCRAEQEAQHAREYAESVVETVHEPLIVLDGQLRVVSANRSFYETFRVKPAQTEGRLLYDLGNRRWDIPELRRLLEDILPERSILEDFEVGHDFERIGPRIMLLNARCLEQAEHKEPMVLLAIKDITERKLAEQQLRAALEQLQTAHQQLRASEQQLRAANQQLQADITERKRMEEKIRASLSEKEVLLKEVHHRVKNNMQVISSILNLQSRHIENNHTLKVFADSQNRIKSMALVHEKLYESEDLAKIDFAEYVRSMTGYLLSLHEAGDGVRFSIDIKDILLDINTAIPCGLIINELVSNSLKYAFPKGRGGEIHIGLHLSEDGKFTLTVKDNGVGLPKGLDFRKTESLGMQLVIMLTEQLDGSIEVDKKKGTTFKITFETAP